PSPPPVNVSVAVPHQTGAISAFHAAGAIRPYSPASVGGVGYLSAIGGMSRQCQLLTFRQGSFRVDVIGLHYFPDMSLYFNWCSAFAKVCPCYFLKGLSRNNGMGLRRQSQSGFWCSGFDKRSWIAWQIASFWHERLKIRACPCCAGAFARLIRAWLGSPLQSIKRRRLRVGFAAQRCRHVC